MQRWNKVIWIYLFILFYLFICFCYRPFTLLELSLNQKDKCPLNTPCLHAACVSSAAMTVTFREAFNKIMKDLTWESVGGWEVRTTRTRSCKLTYTVNCWTIKYIERKKELTTVWGRYTLINRQSSFIPVNEMKYWTQAAPCFDVSNVPLQEVTGTGGLNRLLPTGGSAYGIPF